MITRFKESFKEMPSFMPVTNARQTIEIVEGKLKLKIAKTSQTAEELINTTPTGNLSRKGCFCLNSKGFNNAQLNSKEVNTNGS